MHFCCMQVANYLVRDLAKNTMTAELLQPDELVSGLMSQVTATLHSFAPPLSMLCRAAAVAACCKMVSAQLVG